MAGSRRARARERRNRFRLYVGIAVAVLVAGFLVIPARAAIDLLSEPASSKGPNAFGASEGARTPPPAAAARGADRGLPELGPVKRSGYNGPKLHMAVNTLQPGQRSAVRELGYNLFDIWEDPDLINSLKDGEMAMIWVGNFQCGEFEQSYGEFTSIVRSLAGNKKVFGYYISDEPVPEECPDVVGEIRRRADYIHEHAPGQHAYIVAGWQYRPIRPDVTHVDYFGMDPYPCRLSSGCNLGHIDSEVKKATAAGIPRNRMVPVFQTFGQSCSSDERAWRLPSAAELRSIIQRWNKLVPDAVFDASYSWGRQEGMSCPTLADSPELQQVMREHIAGGLTSE